MSGIGIVLNPHSRSNRKHPERARRLGFIVGDKGSCHETRDLADIERLAIEFRDRGIEILGISGGDGTLHATLSVFLRVYGDTTPLPKIAFLRGGTMNNVTTALGIRGTPESILSNLILKYHRGEPFQSSELGLLKFNGTHGFVFGVGVVERFIEHYERTEGEPTPLRAALLLGRYMISALMHGKAACRLCRRFDATITVDGKRLPFQNYMMIFSGTIEQLGLNFRPLYRAREVRNELQFVAISATPRQLLATFPSAFLCRPSGSEYYSDVVGRHIVMEFEEPMPFMIDGEISPSASRIDITPGPRLTCIVS